jgi:hypothetical protein
VILRGWRQIAAHLASGVRTAQRWEHQGLPVRRPTNGPRSHVIADSAELDSWRLKSTFWRAERFDLLANLERNQELRQEFSAAMANLQAKLEALRKEVDTLRAKRNGGRNRNS